MAMIARSPRPPFALPRAWRLSKMEERLLRAIRAVGPNLLHHERAMLILYGMWEDMPERIQVKIADLGNGACSSIRTLVAAHCPRHGPEADARSNSDVDRTPLYRRHPGARRVPQVLSTPY